MSSIEKLREIVVKHCSGANRELEYFENRARLGRACLSLSVSKWKRVAASKEIASMEHARIKIAVAISAIRAIDVNQQPKVRNVHAKLYGYDYITELDKLMESGGGDTFDEKSIKEVFDRCDKPKEAWIDLATLNSLEELQNALGMVINTYPSVSERKTGRKTNAGAYALAKTARSVFEEFTGQEATYWNQGETPFSRFVQELFNHFELTATIRKPVEAALGRHNSKKIS